MKFIRISQITFTLILLINNIKISTQIDESSCPPPPSLSSFQQPHHHQVSLKSDSNSTKVSIIGNVAHVLAGRVSNSALTTSWPASGIIGFGAGSIHSKLNSLSDLGEALFVNGHAFVRSTDNTSSGYFNTSSSRSFKSTFAVYVNQGPGNSQFTYNNNNNDSISLTDLYKVIYHHLGTRTGGASACCFYAQVRFLKFDGIAVSKAPIYNEPLFGGGNQEIIDSYYTKPQFGLNNVQGLLFGCLANFSAIANKPELVRKLSKVLYINPMDINKTKEEKDELIIHSHMLSYCSNVANLVDISPDNVLGVYHALSSSQIQAVTNGQIFSIESEDKLVELTKDNDEQSNNSASTRTSPLLYTSNNFSVRNNAVLLCVLVSVVYVANVNVFGW